MKLKLFYHYLLCLAIYLGLAFVEIVLANPIMDIVTNTQTTRFIIYLLLIVIINPIMTYFLKNLVKIEL